MSITEPNGGCGYPQPGTFALAAMGGNPERARLFERVAALGALSTFAADLEADEGAPFEDGDLLTRPDSVQGVTGFGCDAWEQLFPPEAGDPVDPETDALYTLTAVFSARLYARLAARPDWLHQQADYYLRAAAAGLVPAMKAERS